MVFDTEPDERRMICMQQNVYECLECGKFTISPWDGVRCHFCHGAVRPIGEAYVEHTPRSHNSMLTITVNVSLKGFDEVKDFIGRAEKILNAVLDEKDVPEHVKEHIRKLRP